MTSTDVASGIPLALDGVPRKLLIAGEWRDALDGGTRPTIDPATGEVLCEVADAGSADVDAAVQAARAALRGPAWRQAPPTQREAWLRELADALEREHDVFALLEALDNGMPIRLAARMVDRAISNLRYFAGWPTKIVGDTMVPSLPSGGGERYSAYTLREPVGVVGAIIPWNASLTSATTKLGPALACGNTVVLKPSENTPLTVLRLADLIARSGLPTGVVNVLTGGPAVGGALAEHAGVDMLAFTGSTAVGRDILRASAGNMKRTLLELGGKSPNIVFADADLRRAIPGAARGIFGNSGQVCTAGSRIYAERAVVEEVTQGISSFAQKLRIGPGLDPGTQLGPVVSERQRQRILAHVHTAEDEGAALVTGGRAVDRDDLVNGFFVEPTVFAGVTQAMSIVRDEVFGPVVTVTAFDDLEEVVSAANDSIYGLAAGVWTRDIDKANALIETLEAGTVWINCYQALDASVPFGGMGASGLGREYGYEAVAEYTEIKSVIQSTKLLAGRAAS